MIGEFDAPTAHEFTIRQLSMRRLAGNATAGNDRLRNLAYMQVHQNETAPQERNKGISIKDRKACQQKYLTEEFRGAPPEGNGLTFERVKMIIAVSTRIVMKGFRISHTGSDRIFGHFLIVGPLFLFFFTGHTDGFVVVHR